MGVLYRTFAVVIDWLFEGIENATTKALQKLRKISRWTVVLATKKSPVCPGFFNSRGGVFVLLFLFVIHLFGSIGGTCGHEQGNAGQGRWGDWIVRLGAQGADRQSKGEGEEVLFHFLSVLRWALLLVDQDLLGMDAIGCLDLQQVDACRQILGGHLHTILPCGHGKALDPSSLQIVEGTLHGLG